MSDARSRARDALNGKLTPEVLDTLVDEVLASTKRARGWCPECQKQVWVEIPDSKAVTSALSELLTQAEGRPGTTEVDSQVVHEYRLEWVRPEEQILDAASAAVVATGGVEA